MPTYAIGDIQGCFRTFLKLLKHIDFSPHRDRLIVCGDMVNRGGGSLAVLHFLWTHRAHMNCLLGNHELLLLALAQGLLKRPPAELLEVIQSPAAAMLLGWLTQRPLLQQHANCLLVHAGLWPTWSDATALRMAYQAQLCLQQPNAQKQLLERFWKLRHDIPGSHMPEEVWALRVLTTVRMVQPHQELVSSFAQSPQQAPMGWVPWFTQRHQLAATSREVVFGHWSALGVVSGEGVIGLDSGCGWGGPLTALRLEDKVMFQVNNLDIRTAEG